MSESSKKIVTPPFLLRRLEAFRVASGEEHSYLLRDKVLGKTYDFDGWQFFILEALPGYESMDRLRSVFQDRFDRSISEAELNQFFGAVADDKLFDERAEQHPLLAPFLRRAYDVEDGKAKPKPAAEAAAGARAQASPAAAAPAGSPPPASASGQPTPGAPAAPASAPRQAPAGGSVMASAAKNSPPPAANELPEDTELPAGVQDALGLDWRTTKTMFGLFDPRPMLRLMAPVLRPLRHLVYAVPLLLLAALGLLINYFHLFTEDLERLHLDVTLFEHLLFLFLTVHIVIQTTAANVAHAFKVSVEKVGLTLTFGFMPRWVLKMNGAERLSRKQAMWLHGSTLIARIVMFSIGILVWFNTRDQNGSMGQIALLLGFVSAIGLLLEAGNPLVKANGYYLLAAFLNEPHLRGKAYAAMLNRLRGRVYRAADSRLLALYGFLSATYVVLIVLVVGWMVARYVLGDLGLGGSAIILTVGFVGYALWRNYAGLKKFEQTYERQVQFDRWRTRTLATEIGGAEVTVERTAYWPRAALVCLVLLLFLPYDYEPGGSFMIFPARKQVIATDEPGMVASVQFDGGERVGEGTVIARLDNDDTVAQTKVLDAKIVEQQAIVDNLRTLPKPQEVALAEQQLTVARTKEAFSREKAPRLEKLYKMGAVSLEEYETARKDHLTDQQQVLEKQASLELVKVPVTASEIAAAMAKLDSLRNERATYVDRLERSVLRMPFDGNILTLHLKNKVNTFLEKGATFATIEDAGVVTAVIDVPEPDVQYVAIGAKVRLRAVSFAVDREFIGTVSVIDRNVTPKPTGNVIQVIATVDNADELLRSGMAGRAKIEGTSMPVWKAFSLAITRFVQIQLWSWLP